MSESDGQLLDVTDLIPHRPPFQLIQSFRMVGSSHGLGQGRFDENGLCVDGGKVLETALIEALAQTVAAINGVLSANVQPSIGYLVSIQDFEFLKTVEAGVVVEFLAQIDDQWGDYRMASGEVRQYGEIKAKGCLRFYVPKQPIHVADKATS